MTIVCFNCGKRPHEIEEYRELASEIYETDDPTVLECDTIVMTEEGTYNSLTRTFACTECYIAAGLPSTAEGWKAPLRREDMP